jgi:hypothetical protein
VLAASQRNASDPRIGDHYGRLLIGQEDVGVGPLRRPAVDEQLLERQRALLFGVQN